MIKQTTIFGWVARILALIAIGFISLFAFDSFEQGTLSFMLTSFALHMIPSFILATVLVITWKYELIGGIIFILIGAGMAIPVFNLNFNRWHSVNQALGVLAMINLPFVVVGLLFMYSHYLLKNKSDLHPSGNV